MPITLPMLRRAAESLEIPECGCPTHLSLLCLHQGEEGCPCSRGRECDCPRWPGKPCQHILSRRHDLPLEQWAALMARAAAGDDDGYDDPPPPASPASALSRQARVAIYAERAWFGRRLFHEADGWRQEPELLKVGLGSTRPAEEEDYGPPAPAWYGASRRLPERPIGSDGMPMLQLVMEEEVLEEDEADEPRRLRNGRPNPVEGLRRVA